MIANGNGVSFWGDEMFWNWMVMIFSKYIKTLNSTLFFLFFGSATWQTGVSSPIRDQTCAHCGGSTES